MPFTKYINNLVNKRQKHIPFNLCHNYIENNKFAFFQLFFRRVIKNSEECYEAELKISLFDSKPLL
jgi:hypothetical protein